MGFIKFSFDTYINNIGRGKDNYKDIKKNLLALLERAINSKKDIILERNRRYLEALERKLMDHINFDNMIKFLELETTSRLLIDVSSPLGWAIDEIGLAWDRFLDTPYIPATAIKGVFRASLEDIILQKLIKKSSTLQYSQQELKGLIETAKRYANIIVGGKINSGKFSVEGNISQIFFYSAYPIDAQDKLINIDVITPIYDKTPQEHEAKPKPVLFLTVAPNVKFKFLFVIRNIKLPDAIKTILDIQNWDDFEKRVNEVLKRGLAVWGIGAKTSSGYGSLSEPNDKS